MKNIPAFIIAYSNSDFTNPHEMVLMDEPKDCTSDYTHMGVKYTGLETCRHLNTHVNEKKHCLEYHHKEHNWVSIGFKQRATILEIQISTKYFTGNQVRAISVVLKDELTNIKTRVLDKMQLQPDRDHSFPITPTIATEASLELYYEGGITRINFLGDLAQQQLPSKENILHKAQISHVSNEHYGHPKTVVFADRKEMYMVGWESARTGFGEQVLFHLEKPTMVKEIVVDTYLHRLNSPLSCHIFGLNNEKNTDIDQLMAQKPRWIVVFEDGRQVIPENFQAYMLAQQYLEEAVENPFDFVIKLHVEDNSPWKPILPFAALKADTYHRFLTFENEGVFTHLLYMHYPNGGIHALKVF